MIDRGRITNLHEEAMELAERGIMEREPSRARGFFRAALEKERAAAELLFEAPEEEPNRSVLYRSAATLAMDCGELGEAERLIDKGLSGRPPAEIARELKDLRKKVRADRAAKQPKSSESSGRSTVPESVVHRALAPRDPKRLVSTKASRRKPD